jgi:hypothetical protein
MNMICGFKPAACSPSLPTMHISLVNKNKKPRTQRERWNDSQNVTQSLWEFGKAHRGAAARQIREILCFTQIHKHMSNDLNDNSNSTMFYIYLE